LIAAEVPGGVSAALSPVDDLGDGGLASRWELIVSFKPVDDAIRDLVLPVPMVIEDWEERPSGFGGPAFTRAAYIEAEVVTGVYPEPAYLSLGPIPRGESSHTVRFDVLSADGILDVELSSEDISLEAAGGPSLISIADIEITRRDDRRGATCTVKLATESAAEGPFRANLLARVPDAAPIRVPVFGIIVEN
jgi:hypothetical protein